MILFVYKENEEPQEPFLGIKNLKNHSNRGRDWRYNDWIGVTEVDARKWRPLGKTMKK